MNNLRHVYQVENSNGFRYDEEFQSHLYQLGLDLCAYKNPAFREEREIRLVHACGLDRERKSIVALGARGALGERVSDPLKTHFRVGNGVLIPYVILDYSSGGKVSPIREVVLGPRNENEELNIEVFLNTVGVPNVTIRRSKAPYRP
jgi:hypothetical protein